MIVLAIIFFIILIVVHEYGHFLAAKRNGVEVEEFGIGFPPKVVGKTFGRGIWRSYYTINLLPLGGFVRLKGEADEDTEPGTYGAATFWVKTKIILAGVFMNLVVAWLMFTGLALSGIPSLIDNQFSLDSATPTKDYIAIGLVSEDSPAERADLEVGDQLVFIGERQITASQDLFDATDEYAGLTVQVGFIRDGQDRIVAVELNDGESDEPKLGVGPADIEVNSYSLLEAPIVGAGTTVQLAAETYKGLGGLLSSIFRGDFAEAADNVSGPVGIFVILDNASVFGFEYLLMFIGIISLTLAVMNSLPLPALDGGKLAVSGLFKLLRRPLTKDVEASIHGSGFVLLMILILLITYVDVQRFF